MACRTCGNKTKNPTRGRGYPKSKKARFTVMGNYQFLAAHQIDKRLAVFKKMYCGKCSDRVKCDYKMYKNCQQVDK